MQVLNWDLFIEGVFRDIEEVWDVVGEFVELYNKKWLIEKLGFKSQKRSLKGILCK